MVLLRVMLIWPTNGHLYLHLSPKKIPSSIIAQCYQYTNLLSETRHVKLELPTHHQAPCQNIALHSNMDKLVCYTTITTSKPTIETDSFTRKANQ